MKTFEVMDLVTGETRCVAISDEGIDAMWGNSCASKRAAEDMLVEIVALDVDGREVRIPVK